MLKNPSSVVTSCRSLRSAQLLGLLILIAGVWTSWPSPALQAAEGRAVKARKGWQSAGLRLAKGDRVDIRYLSGSWTTWEGVVAQHDGLGEWHLAGSTEPLPGGPKGALLGRVGSARPFLIGAGDLTWEANAGGELLLGINDAPSAFHDNSGEVTATVTMAGDPVKVAVPAALPWQTTGRLVTEGQAVAFGPSTGAWTFWDPVVPPHGAAGALHAAGPAEALPGAPKGGLLARIKGGAPVYVGNHLSFTADRDGQLQLRINDADGHDLKDNAGSLRVGVERVQP